MVIPSRTWAAALALASLAGCTSPTEQVFSPPAATPATFAESETQIEVEEFEAGFAKARAKQDEMFLIMSALLEEATRPELIAALKQSAERLKVATQDFNTVQ